MQTKLLLIEDLQKNNIWQVPMKFSDMKSGNMTYERRTLVSIQLKSEIDLGINTVWEREEHRKHFLRGKIIFSAN